MTTKHSRATDDVIGIVLHKNGTLRLRRTKLGNLRAEVIGFHTDEGRNFLRQLHELGEIADEIMCCDDPVAFRLPEGLQPLLHRRRAS